MSTTYPRLMTAAREYARVTAMVSPGDVLTRAFDELEFARVEWAREAIVDEIDDYGCPGSCGFDGDAAEHIVDIAPDRINKAASLVTLRCEYTWRVDPAL